jgi:hypothetical protein
MNDHDTGFQELATILSKEFEAHEKLLSAATGINAAIRKSDLDTMQKRTSDLDEEVFQIQLIEEKRMECCSRLSRSIGIPGEKVRLGAIIEKAPPTFREKLGTLQTALKNALAKIARVTVSNRILIEEGLATVKGHFAIIMRSGSKFAHYQQKGGRVMAALPCNPLFNRTI